ncbi:probable dolichyl pyrophosphate Glc1Man9GlcNAc2 alpha-1,3-glucosyltransferase isoform X1 [Lucilia cuprina]|uniref:probable dolichyl pyrophosphate Glc1Man9GlcNAc2 alpha-1,3-glucosyltransferase isoform X1 n=2 Tax=Lucilia cuprina TaxID=7375 RepID=UPI001F05727A|nr:probable dolichyl pyrophosphate Glc1Man9GlcNAc2 alpha-1,3-glucosyltransferase isoform X1 [Lucilia cuprina]
MEEYESRLWPIFILTTCVKLMLMPAYHSTDFEVHRNWLAITFNLPLKEWYYDKTSQWTLDYPPFFAYFEWLLAQVAKFVDPKMLQLTNLNYASEECKHFQRISVMVMDLVFCWGVKRCINALGRMGFKVQKLWAEAILLFNVGLLFVDHIHFQYNGFLFGLLLLSISYILEDQFLKGTFIFACLLNFKHIFLYTAPAFGIYLLRYYCLDASKNPVLCLLKLLSVGLTPFVLAFAPFYQHLPQVISRLFPFKRGLTHAYWAPNFWALYNTADKVASKVLKVDSSSSASFTSGLVQEYDHVVLPSVRPLATFVLTLVTMLPMLWKLWSFTIKREAKINFLRAIVICSACSFMFGWHVHEKAILMCLIPLCLLFFVSPTDAKYSFMLSAVGLFSLFPLLFHIDLLIIRYSAYLAYMGYMYTRYVYVHKDYPDMNLLEDCYIHGLVIIPIYEHLIGWLTGLNEKLPFLPLLMYSTYCGIGVLYCFIRYYIHALDHKTIITSAKTTKSKTKTNNIKNIETSSKTSSQHVTASSADESLLPQSAKTKVKPVKQKKSQKEKKHK